MTLPSSGTITMGNVKTELGITGTLTLTDSRVRTLFEKPTGAIKLTDGYGKSHVWRVRSAATITLNGGSVTDEANVYDGGVTADTSTYCQIDAQASGTNPSPSPIVIFKNIVGSLNNTGYTLPAQLDVVLTYETQSNTSVDESNTATSSVVISYSLNGTDWTTLLNASAGDSNATIHHLTANVVPGFAPYNLANFQVRVNCEGMYISGTTQQRATASSFVRIYDILVHKPSN